MSPLPGPVTWPRPSTHAGSDDGSRLASAVQILRSRSYGRTGRNHVVSSQHPTTRTACPETTSPAASSRRGGHVHCRAGGRRSESDRRCLGRAARRRRSDRTTVAGECTVDGRFARNGLTQADYGDLVSSDWVPSRVQWFGTSPSWVQTSGLQNRRESRVIVHGGARRTGQEREAPLGWVRRLVVIGSRRDDPRLARTCISDDAGVGTVSIRRLS